MKRYLVERELIQNNIQVMQKKAGSAVIWAVLKGNGYGLGLLPVAETCRDAGLDHFAVTENLAVRLAAQRAPGRHRMYKLVREGNYAMPGVIGWLLRYADTLPLSSCVTTMKGLDRAISRILRNGDFVLVYPEQAMWWYYPKPRPYRIGAFRYAAKNGVPVVPCFVTLSAKNAGKPISPANMRYTIHVCPPIRPDGTHSVREEAERMREENFRLCREVYERVYGKTLDYSDGELLF